MSNFTLRLISTFALVLGLVLGLAACGDDDGDGLPLEDLEEELLGQLCERMVRCGVYADDAACRADFGALIGGLVSQVESGRVDYDAELAARCLEAAAGASCDRTAEENREQLQVCVDALKGTVADGAQCFNDQECISEECEVETCNMACCAGVCGRTIVPAAIGQACPDLACVNGAYCSTQGTCAALLAAGASCNDDEECAYGLFCNGTTCVDAPDRGQPCPDGMCGGIGDRCSDEGTCVALGARGAPCSGGFAFSECQRPLVCNESTLQCSDPPAVGSACVFQCAEGAFCNDTNVCEATKGNGAACTGDGECTSRYCDDFAASPVCADEPVCG